MTTQRHHANVNNMPALSRRKETRMINISLFKGTEAYSSKFVNSVHPLDVTRPEIITQSMWSPSLFEDGVRSNKSFSSTKLMVLDIDSGLSIEQAKKLFINFRHVIGTTRNHQKEKVSASGRITPACDRFRIILELEEVITDAKVYKRVWHHVKGMCPQLDEACKDPARFFYPCTEIVHIQDGAKFPVIEAEEPTKSYKQRVEHTNDPTQVGRISNRAMRFLVEGAPEGKWHYERNNFVRECKQNLYSFDKMMELFKRSHTPDETDLAQIDDIWNNREVQHAPRLVNESFRALAGILGRSRFIQDISNPDNTLVVDLETFERYDIHKRHVQTLVGKKEWQRFFENDILFAYMEYNPESTSPITEHPNLLYSFNLYDPPSWKRNYSLRSEPVAPVDALPPVYDEFFKHLVDNHTESYEYLLNWLALSLQGRNLTFLTAIGEQGAGKGTLGEILEGLHGPSNFVKVRDSIFKERFNAPLKNKTLVYVDEVDLKTKESRDRVKDMANDMIEVEEKGLDARSYRNHASYYLSSNSLDAIKIEPGDRRFSIIQLTDKRLIDTPLIDKRDDLVSEENINLLARYLFHRKINKHEMFTPFRSARYDEVKEASLKDWHIWVIEEYLPKNVGKTLPLSIVKDEIERQGVLNKSPGRRAFQELAKLYPDKMKISYVNQVWSLIVL